MQDPEIGKTCFRITGAVAAANRIQIPKYVMTYMLETHACLGYHHLRCGNFKRRGMRAVEGSSSSQKAARASLGLTGMFAYIQVSVVA